MRIIETKTIYKDDLAYVSWPNLAELKDGTILCAFRHAPDRQNQPEYGCCVHLDPEAKDVCIRSYDGGNTFDQQLHTILDEEMVSNQDPCLKVLSDGRILSTSYRWLCVPAGKGAEVWGEERFSHFGTTFFDDYDAFLGEVSCCYSDNNGISWNLVPGISVPGALSGAAVRGNIVELPNGDLLMPYYITMDYDQLSTAALFRSVDRGETWQPYSVIATDPKAQKNFYEPNIILTKSGKLVALMRTEVAPNDPNPPAECCDNYLNVHMAVSDDYGKTFGPVEEIKNFWGSNPIHALQLKSGKVLVTYGYRREPYSVRARICNGELTDLGEVEELVLRDNSPNNDLAYTSAIQLENGDILVAYYFSQPDGIRTIELTRLRED